MSPPSPEVGSPAAKNFAKVFKRLAVAAGYDLTRRGKGRARLADETGMSVTAVGRTLNGQTLPGLHQYQHIARALGVTTAYLLEAAEIIPPGDHTNGPKQAVASPNGPVVSPETAADLLGVTSPIIRRMLIPNMEQAQRLQRDFDRRGTSGEGAAARG